MLTSDTELIEVAMSVMDWLEYEHPMMSWMNYWAWSKSRLTWQLDSSVNNWWLDYWTCYIRHQPDRSRDSNDWLTWLLDMLMGWSKSMTGWLEYEQLIMSWRDYWTWSTSRYGWLVDSSVRYDNGLTRVWTTDNLTIGLVNIRHQPDRSRDIGDWWLEMFGHEQNQ
jgi:hypothetical protein